MITEKDIAYRLEHGVLPWLDFTNNQNCLECIEVPPVQHSALCKPVNFVKHASGGKILKGVGNGLEGIMHMASGNFGYGLGKMVGGTVNMAVGAVDTNKVSWDSEITKIIIKAEQDCWKRLFCLKSFVPATGNLGDRYLRDGSCDDFHCGNGYAIFENGDYFEGYWDDGEISKGIYIYADGERYLGEFNDVHKHGSGLTIYKDGTYYDGLYRYGNQHLDGKMWYSDGFYEGNWNMGIREGVGFCKLLSGYCFGGNWSNDQPVD